MCEADKAAGDQVVAPVLSRLEASALRAKELYKERTSDRPWWRRGGMHVTEFGAVFTFIVPTIVLARELFVDRPLLLKAWFTFLPICLAAGITPGRPFKPFVNIIFRESCLLTTDPPCP